jgi:drug/metabolite transporter (DMT)-like permease
MLSSINFTKGRAIGFMILSSACWGFATVMSKAGLEHIPPLHLLAIQLAASIAFLWIAVLIINRHPSLNWKTIRYSLTGILEPGLAYTFGMLGLALTTASNASLISTTEPVFIILISWLFLRERITKHLFFLTALAFTGVILIVLVDITLIKDSKFSFMGDILILLGTFCASLYVILSHKIVGNNDKISALSLAAVQQTAGFISTTLIWFTGILGNEVMDFSSLNPDIWILAIASGIVQYALAFWLYLIALKDVSASTAALFLTLIPVFALGGAYLFLNEKLAILQWLGAILIVTSVSSISLMQQQSEGQTIENKSG